jgi:hypothetical protein
VRLNLTVIADVNQGSGLTITLKGKNHQSRPVTETINPAVFRWSANSKTVTTANAFQSLSEVLLEGFSDEDRVFLRCVDLSKANLTLLLPLWAGIPDPRRAEALIRRLVRDPKQYSGDFGLPLVPRTLQEEHLPAGQLVDILWNSLIVEGVLAYGMQQEAADLLTRILNGIASNLKQYQAFRPRHHYETGDGSGDRNPLPGLPPLGLFLDTLGVRLISPWRVGIFGGNPYPWPVEVRYRGLSIHRERGRTTVTFPDGEMVEVDDPADCIVER